MQLSELGLLCLCRWLALGGREGGRERNSLCTYS